MCPSIAHVICIHFTRNKPVAYIFSCFLSWEALQACSVIGCLHRNQPSQVYTDEHIKCVHLHLRSAIYRCTSKVLAVVTDSLYALPGIGRTCVHKLVSINTYAACSEETTGTTITSYLFNFCICFTIPSFFALGTICLFKLRIAERRLSIAYVHKKT